MDKENKKSCRMLVVCDDTARELERALEPLDVEVRRARPPLNKEHLRADLLPHAILLDVRHREEALLRELKGHADLGLVPVMVFLSERAEERVKGLYAAGASLVFLKPSGFSSLHQALARLVSLWCEFVTPPPVPHPR